MSLRDLGQAYRSAQLKNDVCVAHSWSFVRRLSGFIADPAVAFRSRMHKPDIDPQAQDEIAISPLSSPLSQTFTFPAIHPEG